MKCNIVQNQAFGASFHKSWNTRNGHSWSQIDAIYIVALTALTRANILAKTSKASHNNSKIDFERSFF